MATATMVCCRTSWTSSCLLAVNREVGGWARNIAYDVSIGRAAGPSRLAEDASQNTSGRGYVIRRPAMLDGGWIRVMKRARARTRARLAYGRVNSHANRTNKKEALGSGRNTTPQIFEINNSRVWNDFLITRLRAVRGNSTANSTREASALTASKDDSLSGAPSPSCTAVYKVAGRPILIIQTPLDSYMVWLKANTTGLAFCGVSLTFEGHHRRQNLRIARLLFSTVA